jgi:hypothetical protein
MRILFLSLLIPVAAFAQIRPVFTTTKTYAEVIAEYRSLDKPGDILSITESGTTDAGLPLTSVIVSADRIFSPLEAHQKEKCVIMINNAIHPGEPDGVDASLQLVRTYIDNPKLLPADVVLVIIPVYNIDGYLNRGATSRANQNGPELYGFRGNAKNLDLNRDFIKADAQNTLSLQQIFQQWKPDIFIDNHVSDGADYQHTMTLIATQRNKLHPLLATYMDTKLAPAVYSGMKKLGSPLCPYVETIGETPESGIVGFLESPRFATGYAALFNCIGFVPETHMLKPYNDRVWATYDLMVTMINQCAQDAKEIVRLHAEADAAVKVQPSFALKWELDTSKYDMIDFKGYESTHVISKVSGLPVLQYDRTKPYDRKIRYYNTYVPSVTVTKPALFIIPQAWTAVIERLKINRVEMSRLSKDTLLNMEFSYITHFSSPSAPYESHYNHRGTTTQERKEQAHFYRGDYVIVMNQVANRYIMETLDPRGDDSFFAWNFFDGILSQKEWFSDYVFDPMAEQIITENPVIRMQLDSAKRADSALAKNHWLQMNFVYQRSAYKEPTHNRYPVARMENQIKLPLEGDLK